MFDVAVAELLDPQVLEWVHRHESYGNGHSSSECRRGCCWTPFGHSTVADLSHGCRCHGRIEVA